MSARSGKQKRSAKLNRSARAGVLFPVARMHRYLKQSTHHIRIGAGAPVYMAAAIEYLTAEILELAGNAARDNKKGRVTPRHILLAVANDEELHQLLKHVTIAAGGVLPRIHPELLGRKKGGKFPNQVAPVMTPDTGGVSSKPLAPPVKKPVTPVVQPKKKAVVKPLPKAAVAAPKRKLGKGDTNTGNVDSNTGFTILSEKKLFLGQKLTIIQGDIVKLNVDCLVHPTSSNYYLGGEVGQALEKSGGKEFQQEIRDLLNTKGQIDTAQAAICAGRNFPAKFVIHANSPAWGSPNSQELLETCIKNILTLADEKNIKSLAIPSVGSGRSGFPKQAAAQTILGAISNYFVTAMASSLKQIYFVLYDMESIGIYTSELARLDS